MGVDGLDGEERYIRLNGQEQLLKPRDMMMAGAGSTISIVLCAPDWRTGIVFETRRVLLTVYVPPEVGHWISIQP